RVAELQGIEVMLLRQIAAALRPSVLPGERVHLELLRTGTEPGQAVGYLEDGTLVVVEDAETLVGRTVDATIARAVPTRGGRLLFARIAQGA
ncbi:MAG: TRAM domain-containing protein, partial [Actinomycetota bacterium]